MKTMIKRLFLDNMSYKLIAFIITCILWINIFGKVGWGLTHEVSFQILLKPNYIITNNVVEKLTLRLSGPEASVKKFIEHKNIITLNVGEGIGWKSVFIDKNTINVPVGVKVLSVKPSKIRVHVQKKKTP